MGVNSLPKTVTRQRRDCDLNPGPSTPESSTLTARLPSHPLLTLPTQYAEQGLYVAIRPSVRPSVCPVVRQPLRRAAGLLLSAPRAVHTDRQRRAPAPSSNGAQL